MVRWNRANVPMCCSIRHITTFNLHSDISTQTRVDRCQTSSRGEATWLGSIVGMRRMRLGREENNSNNKTVRNTHTSKTIKGTLMDFPYTTVIYAITGYTRSYYYVFQTCDPHKTTALRHTRYPHKIRGAEISPTLHTSTIHML